MSLSDSGSSAQVSSCMVAAAKSPNVLPTCVATCTDIVRKCAATKQIVESELARNPIAHTCAVDVLKIVV